MNNVIQFIINTFSPLQLATSDIQSRKITFRHFNLNLYPFGCIFSTTNYLLVNAVRCNMKMDISGKGSKQYKLC